MDELESVIAESVDTGIYSSITSTSHFENPFVGNEEQLTPDLKVAVTVTVKGAHMHIPDTGVELDIPAGAVRHKQLIEMTIIPFDKQFAPIANFSSNSSVVVELLPNKAIFRLPVHLKLPHCLQLKTNYKEIKNPVKVFVSHHEAGPPVWEEDASAKCTLEEDHCVIHLKRFCWVKYEINDKIVVAKRLKVFTAGKSLHANDCIAEIEVGYHMDLPGREEVHLLFMAVIPNKFIDFEINVC
ncbi:putative netrin receptor UNC5B isoform X2 [Apostichopus japonicus]|uniref:Putative netrin receptor UNC5B isoform X2 n=1 Tax=Stichopus japonicus TaxID=307972 RepID=A0A2G8KUD1_STIJA|nr:putative netrin receptor UNC5B isoform X2 [Apostichopus japonicus]